MGFKEGDSEQTKKEKRKAHGELRMGFKEGDSEQTKKQKREAHGEKSKPGMYPRGGEQPAFICPHCQRGFKKMPSYGRHKPTGWVSGPQHTGIMKYEEWEAMHGQQQQCL